MIKAPLSQMGRREMKGSITLKSIEKLATAIDADSLYFVVPRRPLEEMVRERARVLATQLAREVADSMAAAVDRGAGISPTGPATQWPFATRSEGDEPQAQC